MVAPGSPPPGTPFGDLYLYYPMFSGFAEDQSPTARRWTPQNAGDGGYGAFAAMVKANATRRLYVLTNQVAQTRGDAEITEDIVAVWIVNAQEMGFDIGVPEESRRGRNARP